MYRMTACNPSYCPSRRIPDNAALDLAAEAHYERMLAVPRLWSC